MSAWVNAAAGTGMAAILSLSGGSLIMLLEVRDVTTKTSVRLDSVMDDVEEIKRKPTLSQTEVETLFRVIDVRLEATEAMQQRVLNRLRVLEHDKPFLPQE